MGQTNLVAQPVFILRMKLWNVTMFFNFWALLVKMCLFEIATFFVALYFSSQLSFISGSSNVKDSCVFDEVYFPLCNCCIDNRNSLFFPPFSHQLLLRRQIPSTHQYHSVYGYQTWQDVTLPWLVPTHKVTQSFDHMVL